MKENELISELSEIQHKLQTLKGYSELNASNEVSNLVKQFNGDNKVSRQLCDLSNVFFNISFNHQTGHWRMIMSSQIGWFLSHLKSLTP